MCKSISHPHVAPGWGCCCGTYNGIARLTCWDCGHDRCDDVVVDVQVKTNLDGARKLLKAIEETS